MTSQLLLAIIAISLALIFYTIGVFSERWSGILKIRHIFLFGLGLIFDSTGTAIMSTIAKEESVKGISIHQITGTIAILLMTFHLFWAIFVYFKGDEKAKLNFHKFSLLVWLFWMIPYIFGIILGISH
ncbi:HsmA family protein [Enterococcus faecalis]|uniref:HsmA family protein n=1 Tax=Enterococcus faecalis TaxID=1351 RepID=UPI001F40A89E|nr:HsmA family protein [Enterococcus faecalis]BDC77762.1 membrane protein [Enterococcus faecalis]